MNEYYLDMTPFGANGQGIDHRTMTSGPFRRRDEAERAMREALGTGRFASVNLREEATSET